MTTERRWLMAMMAIAAAGVWLRIVHLNTVPGLNPDEVEVVLQWFRHPVVPWYVAPSGRPHLNPLGPLLLWPFATFANPAPWLVRMPAVLAGAAVLPVLFVMTRPVFDRATAVAATMLAASAPILIAYARIGWDPAYVPVVATLAIGLAFARRRIWAAAAMILLVLVHPTAAFVLIIVAAPFVRDQWVRDAGSPHRVRRRSLLAAACAAAWLLLVAAIAAPTAGIPLNPAHVPQIAELLGARLSDLAGISDFAGGFRQAMQGELVYAGFLGGQVSGSTPWTVAIVITGVVLAGALLRRQRRIQEFTLFAALVAALGAQYWSQGPDMASVFRERYLLWAVVPSILVVVFVMRAICASYRIEKWMPAFALALSALWMTSFYSGYVRPFARGGGESGVLDYRTSTREPKVAVLEAIRGLRQHPASPAQVFVGEGRLQLGMLYLASQDSAIEIKNLGRVLYRYYQRDDREALLRTFERSQTATEDVFFVDYEWDRLPGRAREIHTPAAASVAAIVAPWTAAEVARVTTVDGRPLLKVWRLSRPPPALDR